MKKIFIFTMLSACFWCLDAADYNFKLPVPSRASIEEVNGNLQICCTFAPTKSLPAGAAQKLDERYAHRISFNALRNFLSSGANGNSLQVSGLRFARPAEYKSDKVTFYLTVPRNQVRWVKAAAAATVSQTASEVKTSPAAPAAELSQLPEPDIIRYGSVSREIISDTELKHLQMSGYHIRFKSDMLSWLAMQGDGFMSAAQKDDSRETLDLLAGELQKFVDESSPDKRHKVIFSDSRILRSEAEAIYKEYIQQRSKYLEQMKNILEQKIDKSINELAAAVKAMQQDMHSASAADKAEINSDIKVLQQEIITLKQYKSRF